MTRLDHLLVILMEECAEVQYATSKVLRFGLDDHPPGGGPTNGERLIRELVDLGAVVGMLEEEGAISDAPGADRWADEKERKVEEFLRYSAERRRLSPPPEREGGKK